MTKSTLAEDNAAASHSHSVSTPSKDCHEGEICFVCSGVILEADIKRDGEPALLCEGHHKRWEHASCVGVSEVLYEDIRSCDKSWLCQDCLKEEAKAVQEFQQLKDEVQLLGAENIGLKDELTEVRALHTSMQSALTNVEARVSSVEDTVDLLQATPSPAVSQADRCGFMKTHSHTNTHAHKHTHASTHKHEHTHECAHTHINSHTHAHTHARTHTRTHELKRTHTYIRKHARTHARMNSSTHTVLACVNVSH